MTGSSNGSSGSSMSSNAGRPAAPGGRRIRWSGPRAFLVACGSLSEVVALHARLEAGPLPGQVEALAAAETVALSFTHRAAAVTGAEAVRHWRVAEGEPADGRLVEIEVVYDGEDLDEAGELTGLGREGVIRWHTEIEWVGAFGGFAPGFTYLAPNGPGGPEQLGPEIPRRSSPRTAVPAGAVAVAGGFSAVYPRSSPGGWQVIGRTDATMWDADRPTPALVSPGDRVRYRAVRQLAHLGGPADTRPGTTTARTSAAGTGPAVVVEHPGLQSLLQDLGRTGHGGLGVPAAGAADLDSARLANRILGNAPEVAVIETLLGGLALRARGHHVLALAGAEGTARITAADGGAPADRWAPARAPFALYDGEVLTIGEPEAGLRTYLAVRGGFEVAAVLGSRSTDTLSGLGPEPLSAGTAVPVPAGAGGAAVRPVEGNVEPPRRLMPRAGATTTLRVTPGPRDDWFGSAGLERLTGQDWQVGNQSNRVGVRLEVPHESDGAPLERIRQGELASEGAVTGALQVPPSGLPVLFLADHPVTGGYPVIGVVLPQDLTLAAQLPPGSAVRFSLIDPDAPDSTEGRKEQRISTNTGFERTDPMTEYPQQSASRPAARPLRKVLIANRGEIAVRVARACTDAQLTSVAVYSDPDADALHVHRADEAYALDGRSAAETYLDIGQLLEVARRSGADAVHPGYGFLSENADFAQAVIKAGLTWIGPSPEAIRALGDKASARRIAVAAGAPLVPGTEGPVENAAAVRTFADEHGLPVAIKAAFGGGGRGLRVVHRMEDVESAFDSAVRESVAAFGRGECLVERFLERPRHVEAQVLADAHGTVVVVGTRDCSLQRRNQKLVEEAPAPFLSPEQHERIHASARAICREAGYTGAGTVEYLVSPEGQISFLEVNTRLQVEHPVTEETTGVDLVREQFRIAAGEPLSLTEDPTPRGHALEFRLTAEDPALGFLPTPGTVQTFEAPTGAGVRVDTGVRSGSTVPAEYDSLLAKIIIWGEDRQQAIRRARVALEELSIRGLPTVLPFHRAVLDHADFTSSEGLGVHTGWIESDGAPDLAASPYLARAGAERTELTVTVDGRAVSLGLPAELVRALRSGGGGSAAGETPGPSAGGAPEAEGAGAGVVTAPMDGTVVTWLVQDGTEVSAGQELVVLEAMKMETAVSSPGEGVFSRVPLQGGDPVARGQELGRLH